MSYQTGTISLRPRSKLQFAKEFGWTDHNSVNDEEKDGITHLHSRNHCEINLCNCRRCIRFKLRKRCSENRLRLGRELTNEETNKFNNEIVQETETARQRAYATGRL